MSMLAVLVKWKFELEELDVAEQEREFAYIAMRLDDQGKERPYQVIEEEVARMRIEERKW
jgi:hypothetical protein